MDIIIKAIYHDERGIFHVYYHDIFGRNILLKWCEDVFGKPSSLIYDNEWRWKWLKIEGTITPAIVFYFQYDEDVVAFKLRWM